MQTRDAAGKVSGVRKLRTKKNKSMHCTVQSMSTGEWVIRCNTTIPDCSPSHTS